MNIAFLIPTTSKGKIWSHYTDCFLYKYTLSTFKPEENFKYHFFIGYDNNDLYYKNKHFQGFIIDYFKNYTFHFIEFNNSVYPGHLTHMWNILLENAIKSNMNYFYQCGDDIIFKNKGWVKQSVLTLKMHQDIGITGPLNNHPSLLTQVFFSKKHYDIFKVLFPKYIFNWGCDDWINIVYKPNYMYPLGNFQAVNAGGAPRYDINKYNITKIKETAVKKANIERKKLVQYLSN